MNDKTKPDMSWILGNPPPRMASVKDGLMESARPIGKHEQLIRAEYSPIRARDIRRMITDVQKIDPDVYKSFFGRTYRAVENWHDWRYGPAIYSAALVMGAEAMARHLYDGGDMEFSPSNKNAVTFHHAATAQLLLNNGNPVFFVGPELLEAALHSDLPEVVDWRVMHMPYEAVNFIFPREGLFLEGHEIPFVTYSRKPLKLDIPLFRTKLQYSAPNFSLHSVLPDTGANYDFSISEPYSFAQAKMQEKEIERWSADLSEYKMFHAADTHDLLMRVVFNLLFIMTARPDIVQPGRQIGHVREHKRELKELWEPNIIGPRYRVARPEPLGGTHASPRLHWRRGHYRQQGRGHRWRVCICDHRVDRHIRPWRNGLDGGACLDCDCTSLEVLAVARYDHYETAWIEPMLISAPKEKHG
jgi:hypothetical protein